MSVKLSIEITSPLEPEDRDILSGVAVMTLAIANHEMAKQRFPEMFTDEDDGSDGSDDGGDGEGGGGDGATLAIVDQPRAEAAPAPTDGGGPAGEAPHDDEPTGPVAHRSFGPRSRAPRPRAPAPATARRDPPAPGSRPVH